MIAEATSAVIPITEEQILEAVFPRYLGGIDGYAPGNLWPAGGDTQSDDDLYVSGFTNESQLAHVRAICRYIARKSPYAINGHRNRMNYIISTGHTYKCVIKKGLDADPALARAVQEVVDQFVFENKWKRRQKETRRRIDRDGECFQRMFRMDAGKVKVRFIEPGEVSDPTGDKPGGCRFGIETYEDDVETINAYWVNGKRVEAKEIQHRKENVDSNVRRGCPLFWSVLDTLKQVKTVRRNMSAGSAIQTSTAAVREIDGATQAGAEAFRTGNSPYVQTNYQTGRSDYFEDHTRPGKILTTNGRVKYHFPFANVNYSTYVEVIADNLREIASLLVMPEFMLTSDASNANYSSTMVAEGPAVKNFESYQSETADDDLELLWAVIRWNIECGVLPEEVEQCVEVQVGLPTVQSRNRTEEATRRQILKNNGILSPQTWASQEDLDHDQEQENIKRHMQATIDLGLPPLGQEPEPGLEPTAAAPTVQDAASEVLNGAQITAASAIVTAVVAGQMPRDAALGQLQVFFRMTSQEAELVLGSAGTGAPVKPNPNAATPAVESVRENCGTGAGGFQAGNTCPKGGGGGGTKASKSRGPAKPKPAKKPAKDEARSERAKASHNPSNFEKQRLSDEAEVEMSEALKLERSGDNKPYDLYAEDGSGVELKVMHDANANRVNMRRDSRERKEAYDSEGGKPGHVVMLDRRDKYKDPDSGATFGDHHSGHEIYYRRGPGAHALNQMHKVKNVAELKKLLKTPANKLPELARQR